jgi:hypothetical protein
MRAQVILVSMLCVVGEGNVLNLCLQLVSMVRYAQEDWNVSLIPPCTCITNTDKSASTACKCNPSLCSQTYNEYL